MKTIRWMLCLFFALLCAAVAPASGQQQQTILVGHIDYVEGQLLRYVPENKDWVATVKDAPFGLQDALYADRDARAEIIMPNNTMLRIGGSTQAQLLQLVDDMTELDVASGTARLYNNSSHAIIRATTPFGNVVAPPHTSFDLYVGDDSAEVISLKGKVEFVHPVGTTKYEVVAGSSSVVSNRSQVASGEGMTDAAWNSWNIERDRLWAQRLEPRGETVRYVPAELQTEAYVLEEQGTWEQVNYDGGYRTFWRPRHVDPGWAPYTYGRWTNWYGDNCWVPAEPFGYVTHHYGSWVYVDAGRCWYWAPPVVSPRGPVTSTYTIGYGWYPGRVSWIYTDTYIGWVPLAPYEPYYCRNHWGPSVIVISDHHDRHDSHHGRHHYEDHAVVVHHNNFYNVRDYHDVRIKNIDRARIVKDFRSSPLVNDLVIKDRKNTLGQYKFADIDVSQKPHQTALERVQQNFAVAKRGDRQTASDMVQKLERIKIGQPVDGSAMKGQPQQVTDKLVPDRDVNKPKALTPFATRELKPSGQVRPERYERPQPPDLNKRPDVHTPDKDKSDVIRGQFENHPAPGKPERYERPQPPDLDKRPDVHTPDKEKSDVTRGQFENHPAPGKPERYERPEPPSQPRHYESTVRPEPRVEQPVPQPRHYETTVRPEPRVEQPVPQPRHYETTVRPEPRVEQPVPQPRHYETTVRPEPRVEQPVPQPRHYETTVRPEPRVEQPVPQPRHYETTVRPEPRVEQPVPQPRHIEQPTVHHQQPVPQPGQTPTTVPQQDHHR